MPAQSSSTKFNRHKHHPRPNRHKSVHSELPLQVLLPPLPRLQLLSQLARELWLQSPILGSVFPRV